MKISKRISAGLSAAVMSAGLLPLSAVVAASAAPTAVQFTCVSATINSCVVTIPLTSDMNEQVGSTMPDHHPWFNSELDGNGKVVAPYTMSGPGAPETFWDGVSGGTQGVVWSALLQTGPNEPAGGDAVLTFQHVTPLKAKHYASISWSAPTTALRHQTVSITAVVKPVPPRGHVQLQRLSGKSWVKVTTLKFESKHHDWATHFTWTARKHTKVRFRIFAAAAPSLLLATAGPAFTIKTTG